VSIVARTLDSSSAISFSRGPDLLALA